MFLKKNWNNTSMNALFCPQKGFLAIIVIENLYKTEELLKMQFFVCFCSNCEFNKKDGNLLFSKLIDFDGIVKLFYAPFSTKF